VYEAVNAYSRQRRIAYVHLRNVTGKAPHYRETFIDDGDGDLGLAGTVEVEHVPRQRDRPTGARLAHAKGDTPGTAELIDPAEMPLGRQRRAAEPQPERLRAQPSTDGFDEQAVLAPEAANTQLVTRDRASWAEVLSVVGHAGGMVRRPGCRRTAARPVVACPARMPTRRVARLTDRRWDWVAALRGKLYAERESTAAAQAPRGRHD
jgi:hypothetical protein